MIPLAACLGDADAQPDLSQTVGWLARGGQSGPCQAVAVAPDLVLTAAHCIVETASWEAPGPGEFRFVTTDHAFEVVEAELSPQRSVTPSGAIVDLREDWAILRVATDERTLEAPLAAGGQRAAWRAFTFREPVVKAGVVHAADGEQSVARRTDCAIEALNTRDRLLTYTCAGGTGPGLSGSPLLIETEGGFELIGVLSARERLSSGHETGIVVIPPSDVLSGPRS